MGNINQSILMAALIAGKIKPDEVSVIGDEIVLNNEIMPQLEQQAQVEQSGDSMFGVESENTPEQVVEGDSPTSMNINMDIDIQYNYYDINVHNEHNMDIENQYNESNHFEGDNDFDIESVFM